MKKLSLQIVALVVAAVAAADDQVVNPGFDLRSEAPGVECGWGSVPAPYRVVPLEGMNGTRALYFESSVSTNYPRVLQEVKTVPGRQYRHSAMIRIDKFTPHAERGATMGFFYYDKNGRQIGSYARDGVRNSTNWGKWVKYDGITRPVPEGTVRTMFGPFVHNGCTGKVWFDDLEIEMLEAKSVERLMSSAYRNLAAGGEVTFVATLNVFPGETPLDTLEATFAFRDARGRNRRVPADSLAADQARVTLKVAELAMGENPVGFDLRRRGATKAMGRVGMKFTRVGELPRRKVILDEYGRTLVDGEPFFPLGGFMGRVTEETCSTYGSGPFNCAMSYDLEKTEELDLLQKHGLKAIVCLADIWAGGRNRSLKTVEDEERAVSAKVAKMKDHPNVLAWYVNDEQPASRQAALIRRRQLLERLDDDHPTWAILYQVDDMRRYLPTADIIGSDPYPVPMYPISAAYDYVRKTVEGTCGIRGVWQVPQIFDWAVYGGSYVAKSKAPPTLFEMRSMAWQSIVGGANGLVFFSFSRLRYEANGHTFADRWPEVCAMGEELRKYIPAMLSVEPAAKATSKSKQVPTRVWSHGGKTYLLAVNIGECAFAGEIALDRRFESVESGFGSAARLSAGNRLAVSLSPHEPAMYILKP